MWWNRNFTFWGKYSSLDTYNVGLLFGLDLIQIYVRVVHFERLLKNNAAGTNHSISSPTA